MKYVTQIDGEVFDVSAGSSYQRGGSYDILCVIEFISPEMYVISDFELSQSWP